MNAADYRSRELCAACVRPLRSAWRIIKGYPVHLKCEGEIMRYEIYKDESKQWRWRLLAINGEILASGEAYKRRRDCLAAIALVKASADTRVVEVK